MTLMMYLDNYNPINNSKSAVLGLLRIFQNTANGSVAHWLVQLKLPSIRKTQNMNGRKDNTGVGRGIKDKHKFRQTRPTIGIEKKHCKH